ncbi:hypothetical protein KUTeg_007970 [Tegillarca granosa]|uniref:ATP synthase subunit b n=1 Tax=Tegillarca granosa TaxID=220873 RepID=A0ABQ9FHQ6_TEGGR|nr:hypothetical protein KUTeg_007970 [Tegillarca granosa]
MLTDPERKRLLEKFESEETLEMTRSNEQIMTRLEECREIFYGPERDFENFPTPKMRETYVPIKHGFIPARWFDLLYNKSGVAGKKDEEVMYNGPIRKAKEFTEKSINEYNKEIDYMKNEDFVDEVYEENLGLMLEAEYRQRLTQVHHEVKRRLDYQLELHNTRRRFEQEHMVNWITNSVLKSITPQLEKDSIKSCIATLNTLAKSSKVSV